MGSLKFDSRLKSALELIKREEDREAFSILSKELYSLAVRSIDKRNRNLDENSFLFHYEMVFRILVKHKLFSSFEFFMHFIATDLYLFNLKYKPIEEDFINNIRNYNSLLLGFLQLLNIGESKGKLNFEVSGYEFLNKFEESELYDFIYEFYSVRFDIKKYNLEIDEEIQTSIDNILSGNSSFELLDNYTGAVVESIVEDIKTNNNKIEIENVVKKYKNQMSGSGKTNALKNVTGRVEDFFHQFVYQYFVEEFNSSYVFSELAVTNFRYDLFITRKTELSLVVELKVFRNGSPSINDAIDQVIGYLQNGKVEILKRPLDFGVVMVFNSTGKNLTASNYKLDISGDIYSIKEDDRVIICEIKM